MIKNFSTLLSNNLLSNLSKRSWKSNVLIIVEYSSFFSIFLYWVVHSVARRKGIPLADISDSLQNPYSALLVMLILGFNSLFFGRLFLQLYFRVASYRANAYSKLVSRQLLWMALLVILVVITGGRFDYASYKLQWSIISQGMNPWGFIEGGMINAYGYVFNVLTLLYLLDPIFPKLAVALLFFALALFVKSPSKSQVNSGLASPGVFLILNPYTVSSVCVYGFIDALSSLLLAYSLLFMLRSLSSRGGFKLIGSGALLAMSVFTKFYPLVLLPLFLKTAKIKNQLIAFSAIFLGVSSLTLVISYILWGNDIISPLLFAKGRDPSFLTFWRVVGEWQKFRSPLFVLLTALAVILGCFRVSISSLGIVSAGILSFIFGIYYLGHQQFYLSIVVCLAVFLSRGSMATAQTNPSSQKMIGLSIAVFMSWLIFIQTGFELFHEYKPQGFSLIVNVLSLINSFLLVSLGVVWITKGASVSPKDEPERAHPIRE